MTARLPPCILATCCLPWTEDDQLDVPIFRRSIAALLATGIERLYLFGTAGEGHALTNSQFSEAARIFQEETEGRLQLRQLGLIANSVAQLQERIELGRSLGFDSFQFTLPSWGRVTDSEVDTLFHDVCGRNPDCTFLFYNVARGLRLLDSDRIGELAERYPNLIGVKWATRLDEAQMAHTLQIAPQLGHFFNEVNWVQAALTGLQASLLLSLSSTNIPLIRQMFELGLSQQDNRRLAQHRDELLHHRSIILEIVEQDGAHMDGAYDKLLCKLSDPEFPLRLLPPDRGASDQAFQRYRDRMQAELPHWSGA
ncbi:dihydrodipicolinate synthase family protein [Planctomicrobium sp. SH661]|uniref:dihydrodipicolinate synthase family protein n=1 Tax=Planctomicrobium sp. SH661 TaxID=3448124 RepID=UPI003F5B7C99